MPTPYSLATFFSALSSNSTPDGQCYIPTASNPPSVFLFVSLPNFLHAWDTWLQATLNIHGTNVSMAYYSNFLPLIQYFRQSIGNQL